MGTPVGGVVVVVVYLLGYRVFRAFSLRRAFARALVDYGEQYVYGL